VRPVESLAQGPAWAQFENKHRPVLLVIYHAKQAHKVGMLEFHPKFDLLLDFVAHHRREIPASTKDLVGNLCALFLSCKSKLPAHDISKTPASKLA
jgi:hypothetical protein